MEIEIEGTEAFVRNSFNNIQEFFFKVQGKKVEKPAKPEKKTKSVRTSKKEKAKPGPRPKKLKAARPGSNTEKVMQVITSSPQGTSADNLVKKTGLNKRQIWEVIKMGKKAGKIKSKKRGVYASA